MAVLLTLSPPALGAGGEIAVVLSGKTARPLAVHRAGSIDYVDARQAASLYGGQLHWYPVSGRLQWSFRGRALSLLVGSKEVSAAGGAFSMKAPLLLRGTQAWLPLSLLLSEEFAAASGLESAFDAQARLLRVGERATVGPLRWFSHDDRTRLVLELKEKLSHRASARGVGGMVLALPFGSVKAGQRAEIGDGIVASFALSRGGRGVQLEVSFARPGVKWKVQELAGPRRLVLDFFIGEPPEEGIVAERRPEAARETLAVVPSAAGRRRIVVDAGHGGKDPGAASRRGTLEKDINLRAALELAERLKAHKDFEVLLTRADDTFVPLAERSRLANEFGADLFVSLHCNAARSPEEAGFEVYFLSEKASDPEAERLAEFENSVLALEGKSVRDETAALLLLELTKTENINAAAELAALVDHSLARRLDLPGRGVKQAGFYVLRGTRAPAILFEMAFLTNKKDEARLKSRRFRRKMIEGLHAGILDYAKRQGWTAAGGGRR